METLRSLQLARWKFPLVMMIKKKTREMETPARRVDKRQDARDGNAARLSCCVEKVARLRMDAYTPSSLCSPFQASTHKNFLAYANALLLQVSVEATPARSSSSCKFALK
jgi:hypothetical protein